MFERLKRVVRSRVNGMFDTTPTRSYESTAWNESSPENVRRRPTPNSSEEAIAEDLQTSTTLERRLADELYNVMTMDDAIPWLMNLSRLLEKKSEVAVYDLSIQNVRDIVGGVNTHLDELLSVVRDDQSMVEATISVSFDSAAFSICGLSVDQVEVGKRIEQRSGVSKPIALWWAEIIPLLLPLHKDGLPSVDVTTENGKYILRKRKVK